MENCPVCGIQSSCWTTFNGDKICFDCAQKAHTEELVTLAATVDSPVGFKSWSGCDLSELFWVHLARYQKQPTQESAEIIYRISRWAAHDNHTLSNSIFHALKWCGIDLYTELERWQRKEQNSSV